MKFRRSVEETEDDDVIKDYEKLGGDYLGEMEPTKLELQINSKPSSIQIADDGRPSIGWNEVASGIPPQQPTIGIKSGEK